MTVRLFWGVRAQPISQVSSSEASRLRRRQARSSPWVTASAESAFRSRQLARCCYRAARRGAAVVTAGVVLHVAAMFVWSVVFVWLAERLKRRDALAASLVAATFRCRLDRRVDHRSWSGKRALARRPHSFRGGSGGRARGGHALCLLPSRNARIAHVQSIGVTM